MFLQPRRDDLSPAICGTLQSLLDHVIFPHEIWTDSMICRLIKGFAAKAPAKALETVQTWGNDYHAVIEEDQMVSVVGGRS